MTRAEFDLLTDWIGIPLVIGAVVFLFLDGVPAIAGRSTPSWAGRFGQLLTAAAVIVIAIRFVRLA